jgi:diadenylate cyclase
MERSIEFLNSILEDYFEISMPDIHITDIIEIIIIAVFFYELFKWMKSTRAWMLIRGILVIIGFFIIAALLQMDTILWIGEKLLNIGLIALVIVFQPELRKALEQLGRNNVFRKIIPATWNRNNEKRYSDSTKNDLVKACFDMGKVKTGALIVIEQEVMLKEYERTGIPVDAILTRQLLINIFEKNTPLHDGAVIVRGDRVAAATCYLPLTENLSISKELGTRHRAAVGISEVSDSITIVVSEETGLISVAMDGRLYHDLDREQLSTILTKGQIIKEEKDSKSSGKRHKRKNNVIEVRKESNVDLTRDEPEEESTNASGTKETKDSGKGDQHAEEDQ